MTNINIEFLGNTKTAEGITEYTVPSGYDGEIMVNITFPDSVSDLEKYIQIQSSNERRILKFPTETAVTFELSNSYSETKTIIEPRAGYDDPVKFECISIIKE